MRIVDLRPEDEHLVQQVAALLVESFREDHAWPDLPSALEEVRESFGPGRIGRVAVAGDGTVLGWIGGVGHYHGHAWELHPLVVHPGHRRRGVGEEVARCLFDRFTGRWEVGQLPANVGAQGFWRRAIGRYTGGRYREVVLDDERWRGPVQAFEAGQVGASGEVSSPAPA